MNSRIEAYQFKVEFIDPETMERIKDPKAKGVSIYYTDEGILKATQYRYDVKLGSHMKDVIVRYVGKS